MIQFHVRDMTCGHCVSVITKAAKAVDPQAKVEIDLKAQLVRIEADAEAGDFADAIREAGYTPLTQG